MFEENVNEIYNGTNIVQMKGGKRHMPGKLYIQIFIASSLMSVNWVTPQTASSGVLWPLSGLLIVCKLNDICSFVKLFI